MIRARVSSFPATGLAAAALIVAACGASPLPVPTSGAVTQLPSSTLSSSSPPPAVAANAAAFDAIHEVVQDLPRQQRYEIKTRDGSAELLIPQAALPAGVDLSQLAINSVPPAQSGVTANGQMPVAAWRLSPDGLQLGSAALFLVLNDAQPAGSSSAMVLTTAGGTATGLPVFPDNPGDTAKGEDPWILATPIPELGQVTVFQVPSFELNVPDQNATQVTGKPFVVKAQFLEDQPTSTDAWTPDTFSFSRFEAQGPLDPDLVNGDPTLADGTTVAPGATVSSGVDEATLTCVAAGGASVTYLIAVDSAVMVTVGNTRDSANAQNFWESEPTAYVCGSQ